jgi:adenylate kinase
MLFNALVMFFLYCYNNTICNFINVKVICNIEAMKTEVYNKLEENRGNVSLMGRSLFDKIWNGLVALYNGEKNLKFPKDIVWLNGAPGSGKGTNVRSIMKAMNIFSKPVIVSDLLDSDENKDLMDSGSLVGDEKVVKIVFEKLLDGTCKGGAIIDGFPRTMIQAECAYLLMEKLKKFPDHRDVKFSIIILSVDEKTSIERQLYRGKVANVHNANVETTGVGELQDVRKTDMDPKAARRRYQTFLDQTKMALVFMKNLFKTYEIDATGSFDEIKSRIYKTLRQEK